MSEWIDAPEPYEMFRILDDGDFDGPGVYEFGRWLTETLYVGMAGSLRQRLGDHRRAGMLTVVGRGAVFPTDSVEAAARLERAMIWLLNPTENDRHPAPSGPLWAGTLGQDRPLHGWTWYRGCGHVKVNNRTLASAADVLAAGCSCKPWRRWLDHARSHMEGQAANIELAVNQRDELQERVDRAAEDTIDAYSNLESATEEVVSLREQVEWLEAENARLQDRIEDLETLRERASWTA